ncbi:hypothetical protein F4778DRAFT_169226 [Xylariomycetidae sp. FL2044]|nr:hypothetical protein F4778DRAFT_169226 [Xylariomycetidae sp. FL2044]
METSSRRKACDNCYKRKLRCDGLKPTCSNCSLYKVSCSTTSVRRRGGQASKQTAVTSTRREENESVSQNADTLEARLVRIEAKLDSLKDYNLNLDLNKLIESTSEQSEASTITTRDASSGPSSAAAPLRSEESSLPPLTEAIPIIEDYFRLVNSAVPLFHQRSFMNMLNDFYSRPSDNPRPVWAAINAVLALGYRIRSHGVDDVLHAFKDAQMKKCVDNAQSALDDLVTREEDTLGIQVLLALVILFQMKSDQKPASVLIGTAVRLVHRLQLQSQSAVSQFPPDEARQRANIFWICYFLDKDISLRNKIPSMQRDDDIDLELPGTAPDDRSYYIETADGSCRLNYFRSRVQLANIQGKVYDYVYSNRSRKLSKEARQRRVWYLDSLLAEWRQTIPSPLQMEKMAESMDFYTRAHMTIMQQTYVVCLHMIHGVYSLESPWIQVLGEYGKTLMQGLDGGNKPCMDGQNPPLPYGWVKCVASSRSCLEMVIKERYSNCNVWLSACTCFSAFVVLTANTCYFPNHPLVEQDRTLAAESKGAINGALAHTGAEGMRMIAVINGIQEMADLIAERGKQAKQTEPQITTLPMPIQAMAEASPDPFRGIYHEDLFPQIDMPDSWPPGLEVSDPDFSGIDFSFPGPINNTSYMTGMGP